LCKTIKKEKKKIINNIGYSNSKYHDDFMSILAVDLVGRWAGFGGMPSSAGSIGSTTRIDVKPSW
jgi:hypothetical protein